MQNVKSTTTIKNVATFIAIVLIAIVSRVIPHIPNVAPITALVLFGGVYFDKRVAVVLPLVAMFFSDAIIGFYSGMLFVYLSFFLISGIGLYLRNHKGVLPVLIASSVSSLLFFIVTNFGVWLDGSLYPHTVSGFITCYVMAVPFFRNTLFGDLFYTGVFFGGVAVLKYMENKKIAIEH